MDDSDIEENEAIRILKGIVKKYEDYKDKCYVPKLNYRELSAIKYFISKGENTNGKK